MIREVASPMKLLEEFVELQRALVGGLMQQFELSAADLPFNLPRSGEVIVGGSAWRFHRHGLGILFSSLDGRKVDVHEDLGAPHLFDSWRVRSYVGSLGTGSVRKFLRAVGHLGSDLETAINEWFHELEAAGQLQQEPGGSYRLAARAGGVAERR